MRALYALASGWDMGGKRRIAWPTIACMSSSSIAPASFARALNMPLTGSSEPGAAA